IEYGLTLLHLNPNDPKGHAALGQATDQLIPLRNAAAPPVPTVGALLEYLLNVPPQLSRSRILPAEAGELALRWFPDTPPLLWLLAQQAFQREEFHQAAVLLDRLVQLGRTGSYDRSVGFNPLVMGAPALMNLGICHLRL